MSERFSTEEIQAGVLAWEMVGRKYVPVDHQAVVSLTKLFPRHSAASWKLRIWDIQRVATEPAFRTTAAVHEVVSAYLA
jgi:hypothetical protein